MHDPIRSSKIKDLFSHVYSFFTSSVRRTFFSIILFAILMPFAVITVFSFSRLIKQSEYEFNQNNKQLSNNAAMYFGDYFRSIDQVSLELYSDDVLNRYLQHGISPFITENEQRLYIEQRIRSFYYQIKNACLSRFVSSDRSVEATFGSVKGRACTYISSLQYTPYTQIHETEDAFSSDELFSFYRFEESDKQYLAYTRAVQFLSSHEIDGYLTFVIEPSKLNKAATSYLGTEKDSLFIFSNTDHQLLLEAGNTDIHEDVAVATFESSAVGEAEKKIFSGHSCLLYRYPIDDCGITLCWVTPSRMTLSGSRGILWRTAVILAVLFFISLLLTILLSKSITRKVDQLISTQVENAAAMQEMEFRTLQATLNPHFIANTLQPIGKIALEHNLYEVKYLLDSFCDIIRYSLKSREPHASVANEMSHLEKYLRMQRLRLGEHFDYSVSFDPKAGTFLIPRMTLQPLAENVISYGFDENTTDVRLDARAVCDNNYLILEITDNGAGFKCDLKQLMDELNGVAISNKERITGIGLSHVNSRLRMLFGDRYSINISSVPTQKTSVQIRIAMENNT